MGLRLAGAVRWVVIALAATVMMTGCGPKGSPTAEGTTGAAPATSAVLTPGPSSDPSSGSASGAPAGTSTCPTQNTTAFAKTRLVADLGLVAGTFHRYIYTPYKAGAFDKGAEGRVLALVKASATAAADAKLLSNAVKNVQANPTLCGLMYQPMVELAARLSAIKGEVAAGNLASIESAGGLVSGLLSRSSSSGLNVVETTGGQ